MSWPCLTLIPPTSSRTPSRSAGSCSRTATGCSARSHDAEDLVQETYLRAWRSYGGFERRSSVRTWLYRIATNACLTALQRGRRVLPSGLGRAVRRPVRAAGRAGRGRGAGCSRSPMRWSARSADPAVDRRGPGGPAAALIASLQHLPARQRAVLLLREVLAFPAAEVAADARHQRRRGEERPAARPGPARGGGPDGGRADRAERAAGPRAARPLHRRLRERRRWPRWRRCPATDAALELVGSRAWFSGRATCLPFLTSPRSSARRGTGGWCPPAPTGSRPPPRTVARRLRRVPGLRDRRADWPDRDRPHRRVRRPRPRHHIRLPLTQP